MIAAGSNWIQRSQSALAGVFLFAVAMTAIAYGSVSQVSLDVMTIWMCILTLLATLRPIAAAAMRRTQSLAILLMVALLAYTIAQILPFMAGDFVNPAWKTASEVLGPIDGTISVAPGMTFEAMPALALPFLTFICALSLFQGDDEVVRLWRVLAYFGAGYALFGILQEVIAPDQILLEHKRFYVGNVTATFVNRNSAGTFFGLAFLLNLGLVVLSLRRFSVKSFIRTGGNFKFSRKDPAAELLMHMLFTVIVAMALFLSQSRGAFGATAIATVVGIIAVAGRHMTADRASGEPPRWLRHAKLAGVLVAAMGCFFLFAGRSVYRLEEQGTTDDGRWCTYASTWQAIKDYPYFGTGFGTFADVFPAYRNPDCDGIFGTWDRAHNVYLEGYLGLGAPFAVALVLGYAFLIGVLLRGRRNRHRLRFLPAMGLAALVLVSVHSLVDFSLQIPGVAVYFSAILAAAVGGALGGSRRGKTVGSESKASAPSRAAV